MTTYMVIEKVDSTIEYIKDVCFEMGSIQINHTLENVITQYETSMYKSSDDVIDLYTSRYHPASIRDGGGVDKNVNVLNDFFQSDDLSIEISESHSLSETFTFTVIKL